MPRGVPNKKLLAGRSPKLPFAMVGQAAALRALEHIIENGIEGKFTEGQINALTNSIRIYFFLRERKGNVRAAKKLRKLATMTSDPIEQARIMHDMAINDEFMPSAVTINFNGVKCRIKKRRA